MAGAMSRMAISHRILTWDSREIDFSGDPAALNISDTVFGFLEEESEGSSGSNSDDNGYGEINEAEEEEDEEKENTLEEDKNFWEKQNQLLHATLFRTSSIESRIRNITKDAVKEAQQGQAEAGSFCVCGRATENGCRNCLMKEVCRRLQNAGFNSSICKSKWRGSPDIPSGEHTFLDVVDNSNPKKGEVRIIIELSFQAEFEMARASEEYNQLIKRLPQVFVGKVDRLLSLIKILCSAAKKCMKVKKIHMGPWRKQRYMQAKWLRTCERTTTTSTPLTTGYSSRPARSRASMLTVDLLENLPSFNRTAVEVV